MANLCRAPATACRALSGSRTAWVSATSTAIGFVSTFISTVRVGVHNRSEVGDQPWKFHKANLGEACANMFAADLDGDGKNDVISSSAHHYGIWSYLQRSGTGDDPAFVKKDLFPDLVSETHAMHFVDIDGDGLKDLVTGKRWYSHGNKEPGADKPAMLYWFKAKKSPDGMISFTPIVIDDNSGIGTQFTVADVNGDKLLDIVTANKRGVFLFEQVREK